MLKRNLLDKFINILLKKKINADNFDESFGESMYTNSLSLKEVGAWVFDREDKVREGATAIVLKANSETLKGIEKTPSTEDEENKKIIIAIVDMKGKEIFDSVLIKYEELDSNLEKAFNRGNGVFEVGV